MSESNTFQCCMLRDGRRCANTGEPNCENGEFMCDECCDDLERLLRETYGKEVARHEAN